jgi:hypothetical protein
MDDEAIALPQDKAYQDTERGISVQEMCPLRHYSRHALYESSM